MYRKQEAAQSVKQARHYQKRLDDYITLPMLGTMTLGQFGKTMAACFAFVLLCFAILHGAAVVAGVI